MKKNKKRFAGLKYIAVALLSLTFLASSKPAHAQWAVFDVPQEVNDGLTYIEDAAKHAMKIAQDALQVQQWDTSNMDKIIHEMITTMSKEMNALTKFMNAQMITDGMARETQKKYTVDYTMQHSMIMPKNTPTSGGVIGQDSGLNLCTTANVGQSSRLTGDAVNDMTRALVSLISKLNIGSNSLSAAQYYAEACKRGFVDPSLFQGTTQCLDATTINYTMLYGGTVQGSYYYGADQNPDSVLGPSWYMLPAGTKVSAPNNQLVLPAAVAAPQGNVPATTSKEEMDFIAAIYACRFASRPVTLDASLSANNTVKSDANTALRLFNIRQQIAAANAMNAPCLREVARRTRVSKATADAAAAGTVVKEMYNAEISRCQALDDIGIMSLRNLNATPAITNPTQDLADCVQNGRSMLEMDEEEACHWGHGNWHKYTVGSGVDAERMAVLDAKHTDDCVIYSHQEQDFKSKLEQILAEVIEANPVGATTGVVPSEVSQ